MKLSENIEHDFGGAWTTEKLDILTNYINAYTNALKGQKFNKIYIDAFAGTGYRTPKQKVSTQGVLIKSENNEIDARFLSGSARIALQATTPFDRYIFIEKNTKRCKGLNALKAEFPELADRITIIKADANQILTDLCSDLTNNCRALLFLDPYGMQVGWDTIKKIAESQKIDLWYLFGLGGGLNRLLKNDGKITPMQKQTISNVLGTTDWFEEFYKPRQEIGLWDDVALGYDKVVNPKAIGNYLVKRLATTFPGVAKNPRYLVNTKNSPLYLFCFAVSNPNSRAISLALKIAESILGKKGR